MNKTLVRDMGAIGPGIGTALLGGIVPIIWFPVALLVEVTEPRGFKGGAWESFNEGALDGSAALVALMLTQAVIRPRYGLADASARPQARP